MLAPYIFMFLPMILDGKSLALSLNSDLKEKISLLPSRPKLVAVLVGNNSVSLRYIQQKQKAAQSVGIDFELLHLDETLSEGSLQGYIHNLNNDSAVSGYILQLPLPQHIRAQKILERISPLKDVDGFHPVNQGKTLIGDTSGLTACTPAGVMKLFEAYQISLA